MSTKALTVAVAGALALFAQAAPVHAQSQQSTTSQTVTKPAASSAAQHKAVEDLQRASQRLRDALAALERESASGPNHDQALKAAREALQNTQETMTRLQAETKVAQSRATPAASGSTGTRPSPAEALKRLRAASDSLYDAVHAMAKLPAGSDRNEAIKKADQALFETEQAAVLSELDYKAPAARSK
jgi:hypothetical protein